MGQTGIGVMIYMIGGGSAHLPSEFVGKKIVAAEMLKEDPDRLVLAFEDGHRIAISDTGQSCCESRYMTTDDDLSKIVGGVLRRIECKEGPIESTEWGDDHDTAFLEIGTDECFVTLVTHVEHNGYYGGFAINIDVL